MIRVNLMLPRVRALLTTQPQPHPGEPLIEARRRLDAWERRVQLLRNFPRPDTPAPLLHRPGYYATPTRVAPACASRAEGGPYGRVVWVRPAVAPYPMCSTCYPPEPS